MKQLFFTIFVVVFSAVLTLAQVNPDQVVQNARDQFSDIKNRSIELERVKRDADKPSVSNDSTLRFPMIKQDFEQIQKINDEVLQQADAKSTINYAEVLKAVAEINRRAARLKSNLFALELKSEKQPRNKEEIVSEPSDMKVLLGVLDKSINDFVHNSIFQNINIVNSQDSLKARNDLEMIVKNSFRLKEKIKQIIKDDSDK